MSNKSVFFILGCVRSGTTLLRQLLKSHPDLACSEETHLFRWADPFASNDFTHVFNKNVVLKKHREIDGIDNDTFMQLFSQSLDRKDMLLNYFEKFAVISQQTHKRLFEKTPQNVYGLALIKAYFPDAQIIHIIRNPLNVVASLKMGRGLNPQSLVGAINFWKESVLILQTLKPLLKGSLIEIKYENLTQNPVQEMSQLLHFLNEKPINWQDNCSGVLQEKNLYLNELTKLEISQVKQQLKDLMGLYGYL